MNKHAIEVKNYTFSYAGTERNVLEDCDFTLDYGEFSVLTGYSGEGKSTLIASIIGSIPHILPGDQSGEVWIAGKNIEGMRISEISRFVGSVLQNADSQIVHDSVEDEIAFGCENICMDIPTIEKQIGRACEEMQLDRKWRTRKLSGGQKQRLITATTLAMGQKILVFDEPLANLDLEGAQLLMESLRRLAHKQGYAVLFVEHRLDMVLPYVDRVIWMKNGKTYEEKDGLENYKKHMSVIPDTGKIEVSKEKCLELKDICFGVEGRQILQDISFDINKGERIVILGENGCGKTTLLRIIARLLKPTSGEVVQHIDRNIKPKPVPAWFRKVGFVYQNPSYQLFMPQVIEEIGYQSESEENTKEYVEKFGLEQLSSMHSHALSEGQKRKVSIAAIAAQRPEVLLLDEPTVGQDYEGLKRMIGTLNDIHKEYGTTMITITHDYRCAAAVADRVIWMHKGKIYRLGGKELIDEYFLRNVSENK